MIILTIGPFVRSDISIMASHQERIEITKENIDSKAYNLDEPEEHKVLQGINQQIQLLLLLIQQEEINLEQADEIIVNISDHLDRIDYFPQDEFSIKEIMDFFMAILNTYSYDTLFLHTLTLFSKNFVQIQSFIPEIKDIQFPQFLISALNDKSCTNPIIIKQLFFCVGYLCHYDRLFCKGFIEDMNGYNLLKHIYSAIDDSSIGYSFLLCSRLIIEVYTDEKLIKSVSKIFKEFITSNDPENVSFAFNSMKICIKLSYDVLKEEKKPESIQQIIDIIIGSKSQEIKMFALNYIWRVLEYEEELSGIFMTNEFFNTIAPLFLNTDIHDSAIQAINQISLNHPEIPRRITASVLYDNILEIAKGGSFSYKSAIAACLLIASLMRDNDIEIITYVYNTGFDIAFQTILESGEELWQINALDSLNDFISKMEKEQNNEIITSIINYDWLVEILMVLESNTNNRIAKISKYLMDIYFQRGSI